MTKMKAIANIEDLKNTEEAVEKKHTEDIENLKSKAVIIKGRLNNGTVTSEDESYNGLVFDMIPVQEGDAFVEEADETYWWGKDTIMPKKGDLIISKGTNASSQDNWLILRSASYIKELEEKIPSSYDPHTLIDVTVEEDVEVIVPIDINPESFRKIVVLISTVAPETSLGNHPYIQFVTDEGEKIDLDMWGCVDSSVVYGEFEIDLYNDFTITQGHLLRGYSSGTIVKARWEWEYDTISKNTVIAAVGYNGVTLGKGSRIRVIGVSV
jgi:hypothetical protein